MTPKPINNREQVQNNEHTKKYFVPHNPKWVTPKPGPLIDQPL